MQLPIKAHYATVAMLALAQSHESGLLLTARAIADEQGIPAQFLVQILQQLRAAGMVSSTRGSSGGFRLERSPHAINLAEIIDAVCPGSPPSPLSQASALNRVALEVWHDLYALEQDHLRRLTLADLCSRAQSDVQAMFYI